VKISNGNTAVEIIETNKRLDEIAGGLQSCTEIFIDTEFDEFKTQYGVHLQLIQIFDGKACYLIDTVQLTDLDILWRVFEDENICKVLYAASSDVAILKKYGCNTTNIFDIQVAAFLCNRAENSYAGLVHAELGIEIDKTCQTSRWGDRPLKTSQIIYASNDVIHLPALKQIFLAEVAKKNMLHILKDENVLLQNCVKKNYEPKLSGKQKKVFSYYTRGKLMEFKRLINDYAKLLNVPLFYIVQDSQLEEIVKDKAYFLKAPFAKGFYKEAVNLDAFKKQFLELVHSIDTGIDWQNPMRESADKLNTLTVTEDIKLNNRFLHFREYMISKYGETASSILLQGLSKKITDEGIEWEGTKLYQRDLYSDFLSSHKAS